MGEWAIFGQDEMLLRVSKQGHTELRERVG